MEHGWLVVYTAVLCVPSLVLLVRDWRLRTDTYGVASDGDQPAALPLSAKLYSAGMIALTLGASLLFLTLHAQSGIWVSLKRMALLSMLWPIGWIDARSYRIPNALIALGLGYRAMLLPFELLFHAEAVWSELLSEVISAGALLLAALLCGLCIKNAIGFGDMKLFLVLGLLLGLDGIWGAIFLSLIVSFVWAVVCLVTKQKTRKDAIPFGPAIVIGTYLSVCLSGM